MTTPDKEIIYRKVFIRSVNDLPTKEDEYYVHTKKDRLEVHIWYGANFNANWMALIDWYLLPVELPTDEDIFVVADKKYPCYDEDGDRITDLNEGFIEGAKAMRDGEIVKSNNTKK